MLDLRWGYSSEGAPLSNLTRGCMKGEDSYTHVLRGNCIRNSERSHNVMKIPPTPHPPSLSPSCALVTLVILRC